ncbi:MAG: hypothetical protein GF308_17790 [Candidatus Heimdallarchaeota archaeon]|nr:hypothetical protein [Candidatus Heimdallarchaeota archaeon]
MSEKLIKELEEFLLPYALERYNISDHPFGDLVKTIMGEAVERLNQYITWLVRAFIRCILSTEKGIYLKDITTVMMAEAYNMMNFTPVRNIHTPKLENLAGSKILLEGEVHHWLLELQEQEMLPGYYDRFMGYYISNS